VGRGRAVQRRPLPSATATARVPAGFVALAEVAVRHRDEGRFALLYRVLWRLTHGEPALLAIATDADMVRLHGMVKAIRRDAHKMHAFVRFRCVATEAGEHYVAWFEPEHHILEAEAGSSCGDSRSCGGRS
jgi:DNA polymerase